MAKTYDAYVTVTVKIKNFVTANELAKGRANLRKFAQDELNTIEFRHDGNTLGKISGKDYRIDNIMLDDF